MFAEERRVVAPPSYAALQLQRDLEALRKKFNVVQEQEQVRALEQLELKKQQREAAAAAKKEMSRGNGAATSSDSSFDFNADDDDDDELLQMQNDGGSDNNNDDDEDGSGGAGGNLFGGRNDAGSFLDALFDGAETTNRSLNNPPSKSAHNNGKNDLHHHEETLNTSSSNNNNIDDDEIFALFHAGSDKKQQQQPDDASSRLDTTTKVAFARDSSGDDDGADEKIGITSNNNNTNQQQSSFNPSNGASAAAAAAEDDSDETSMADALLAFAGISTTNKNNQQQQQQQQQIAHHEDAAKKTVGQDVDHDQDDNQNDDLPSFFRVDNSYQQLVTLGKKEQNAVRELPELLPHEVCTEPFQKDFYIPPSDVEALSEAEVKALLESLDGATIKGKHPLPRPMRSFEACGLTDATVATLRRRNFLEPFAVQAIAIPALMSGRDLFLTAKTGSGKTLAYLLPLIRHVYNQRRARPGEGPVGLVVVPTHELAEQIETVSRELFAANQLRVMRAYGSVKLEANVRELGGGVDVCIATPGRLKGICVNGNKTRMFLARVTFVVLDEVDRLMDEGLGRTVQELLVRVRPDHQIALVSSTIPEVQRKFFLDMFAAERKEALLQEQLQREAMLKKHQEGEQQQKQQSATTTTTPTNRPPPVRAVIEISVGGKPNPSTNVTQSVEFFNLPRAEDGSSVPITGEHVKKDPRWRRLVQILGEHYEKTDFTSSSSSSPVSAREQVIVFVESKELCDHLYVTLEQVGYGGLVGTLYAGRDTDDRQQAMHDFASGERPILVATGVAERGLDVQGLSLVINYDVPNHFEAYVNRVGRTGRAGRRGKAITFFLRGVDDHMAAMLVKSLDGSHQLLPDELKMIAAEYEMKVKEGLVQRRAGNFATGYGRSRTFSFRKHEGGDEFEGSATYQLLLENKGGAGGGNKKKKNGRGKKKNDDDDSSSDFGENDFGALDVSKNNNNNSGSNSNNRNNANNQLVLFHGAGKSGNPTAAGGAVDLVQSLLFGANQHRQQLERGEAFSREEAEFDLNQQSERVRRRLTSRKELEKIGNETGTGITVKGRYVTAAARRMLQAGERELHLLVRGPTQQSLHNALRALNAVATDESRTAETSAGFYNR